MKINFRKSDICRKYDTSMYSYKAFAHAIAAMKTIEGVTQEEIAQRIGVTNAVINNMKGGRQKIPQATILKITREFPIFETYLQQGQEQDDDSAAQLQRLQEEIRQLKETVIREVIEANRAKDAYVRKYIELLEQQKKEPNSD